MKRISRVALAVFILALAVNGAAWCVTLEHGDIVLACSSAAKLLHVDRVSGAQTTISTGGSFVYPNSVAFDANGMILVADHGAFDSAGAVFRIDPANGQQTTVSAGGNFDSPLDLDVASNGDLVVVDSTAFTVPLDVYTGAVFLVDPETGMQTTLSSHDNLVGPSGVALESNGDIVVVDSGAFPDNQGGVIRVDPVSGAQSTVSAGGSFVYPYYIAVADNGDIYVNDYNDGGLSKIYRVDPVTGLQTLVTTAATDMLLGLDVGVNGDLITTGGDLADIDGIYSIDTQTGIMTLVATGPDLEKCRYVGVYRIPGMIFADGFESGDFAGWSSAVP